MWTVIGIIGSWNAVPAAAETGNLPVRTFPPDVYQASGTVTDLGFDSRGVLFAATPDGVLVFDGARWQVVRHPRGKSVRSLAVGRRDEVYVGCSGDLGVLVPDEAGELRFHSLADQLPDNHGPIPAIHDTTVCDDGVFFLGEPALLHWQPSAGHRLRGRLSEVAPDVDKFFDVSSIGGRAVVSQRSGIGRWEDGQLTKQFDAPGYVTSIVELDSGRWLISAHGSGLHIGDTATGACEYWDTPAGRVAKRDGVWHLIPTGAAAFAMATQRGGVVLVDSHGETRRPGNIRVSDPSVMRLATDAAGDLWMGTAFGLAHLDLGSPVQLFDATNGLRSAPAAIARHHGLLYVGGVDGVSVLDGKRRGISRFSPLDDVDSEVWGWSGRDDQLLGVGKGLVRVGPAGDVLTGVGPSVYASGQHMLADKSYWLLGTFYEGLLAYTTEVEPQRAFAIQGSPRSIRTIVETGDSVWISGRSTEDMFVYRVPLPIDAKSVAKQYGAEQGVSATSKLVPFTWQGALWVSTPRGLLRFNSELDRFEPDEELLATVEHELPGQVSVAAVDSMNHLWLATDRFCVARLSPGKPRLVSFPLRRLEPLVVRTMVSEADGTMWISAQAKKLVRYDTNQQDDSAELGKPMIGRVSADGTVLAGGHRPRQGTPYLPYSSGTMRFEYSLPARAAFAGNKFQTRLVGMESGWTDWTTATSREFTALREGTYKFAVRARDEGLGTTPTVEYAFRVLPPWYRTSWIYLLYGAVATCGMCGIVVWQVHSAHRTIDRLQSEIEARKRAQAESERYQAQLLRSQKLESIGTLATGVAHDVNNSLAAIVCFAEVAASSVPKNSPLAEYLAHILDATVLATGTTKGLLTFSGEEPGEKKSCDLGQVVSSCGEFLRRILPASVELVLRMPGQATNVVIDQSQIKQVIMNLVVNARDALPSGGVIVLSLEPSSSPPGYLLLSVADDGVGMSDEVRQRVFDPFFTTKKRGQGTGLGLSIVHGIIEDHGGTVEVVSEVGTGTTIKMMLPIADMPAEQGSETVRQRVNGLGHTVLLVEDNPHVRAAIGAQLRALEFVVIEAGDGEQALREYGQAAESIRLAIMDIDLPKLDGVSCLHRIREQTPELPVILISGLPCVPPRDACFLRKPFGEAELTAAILATCGATFATS
ncbi:MAG: response regulator [Planctomycetales bacterium]|nr:response regulator [Planctomycetales bacterium]